MAEKKRKGKERPPFMVKVDSREKTAWDFPADPKTGCVGSTVEGLPTGDYTLAGYEKVLCIERKASTGEFAKNVCEERFERELARMGEFPLAFVLCEFTGSDIQNFPVNSGIPNRRWGYLRVTPAFLWKRIAEFSCRYGVPFLLAGDNAQSLALDIFKWVAAGNATAAGPEITGGAPPPRRAETPRPG